MDFFDDIPIKKEPSQIYGVMTATILENYNKDYLGMVKISYAFGEKGKNTSGWVPFVMPYVGAEAGTYFMPEVGTEVLVSFIMGNVDKPVVVGSLWSDKVKRPTELDYEKNTVKMIKTKAGHQIVFNEETDKESITITSKKGINILLSDEKEQLTMTDTNKKNEVTVDFKGGALTLNAETKINLQVGGTNVITVEKSALTLESTGITVKASSKLDMQGQATSLSGSTLELKSDASFKANSSGILEIKGTMVKLN